MKPQNLLFILSDEHNRDYLGCYGHPLVATPHLDGLAQRGVRFDSAYTNCPICVPARASLATGRYVHEIGYWDNAFPYDGRVPGWGHRLQAAGHRVDAIGKLHYRYESDDDGFSHKYLPMNVVDGVGDVMGSVRDDMPIRQGTRAGIVEAGPGESTYLQYDEDIAEKAARWLEEFGTVEEKPWVLFVSFVCPHPPFVAPPDLYAQYPLEQMILPKQLAPGDWPDHPALTRLRQVMQYDPSFTEEQVRKVIAAYCGACTHLDRQVGKVLNALGDAGLNDQTRIIYTSDHGESMGNRGLWGKFTMYEESAAIPMIVAGPDIRSDHTTRDPVSLIDCYPTILEAVGLPLQDDEQSLPGRSLWQIAKGDSFKRDAFSEYHAVASEKAWYMLRRGDFKYIHYVDERPQLFDLRRDPDELNDLACDEDYAEKLHEMKLALHDILDPEEVDRQARRDQQRLIDAHGGRDSVLKQGTFINSPVPGEELKRTGP